jgi:hypothetical protein
VGASESVLHAGMAFDAEAGAVRLSMQMQSGDEIVIAADRFDLEIDAAPRANRVPGGSVDSGGSVSGGGAEAPGAAEVHGDGAVVG